MKKRFLFLPSVCMLLLSSLLLCGCQAQQTAPVPEDTPKVKALACDGNLLKITTEEDFEAGVRTELEPAAGVGNGALKLADGAQRGEFVSAVYDMKEFEYLVVTWNAALPADTSVEVSVRGYIVGTLDEQTQAGWTSWLSYGAYGPRILRGSTDDIDTAEGHGANGWAYLDTDTFSVRGTSGATHVQLKAVLTRADGAAESPVLRQLTATTKNTNEGKLIPASYAETPYAGTLPEKVENPAPAYAQGIRDPEISGSICSPSTISVMLNSRNPALDLLPEEVALNVQDFSYGFGNWSYCVAGAGLYGYEAYAQYADKDILLQELAKGNTVGLSVNYSTKKNAKNYLAGAYGETPGHLITLVGYYYEDGHANDEAYLHFYSSDTYSKEDATAFHDYKWTQLDKAWEGRLAYLIPAQQPEEGAAATGVTRVDATLREVGEHTYEWMADGVRFDLTGFTTSKTWQLGRGVLAYTVAGVGTDMKTGQVAGDASIVYPNAVQVTANSTFGYTNLDIVNGNLAVNANALLAASGVPVGETRTVTVYAIANNGYLYRAAIDLTRTAPTAP